jgi:hypothetical protein
MDHPRNIVEQVARRVAVVLVVWFVLLTSGAASSRKLGALPAGTSPDSVDFSATEMFVLDRGTVSVYSLPDIVLQRTFGGSGTSAGKLSPRHIWDQTVRVVPGKIIAEDEDKIVFFSQNGRVLSEKQKPANTTWFVPFGAGFVAKSMVLEGNPPLQYIRVALYDAELKEVKELYRQKWFQQPTPKGFQTEFPGDLLHFAVAGDRLFIEESPGGWVIEIFDAGGHKISTVKKPYSPIPVTPADREGEAAQVRREKRVAAMIARAGSWEKLREVWSFAFSDVKPALRELQALGDEVLARTFEQRDGEAKFLVLDREGRVRKELFLPVGTDAETEARVCGTSFFKIVNDSYYFLRHDSQKDLWEVHAATAAGL